MFRTEIPKKFNIILNVLAELGIGASLSVSQIFEILQKKLSLNWSLRSLQRYIVEMESKLNLIEKDTVSSNINSKQYYKITERGRLLLNPEPRLLEDVRLEQIRNTKAKFGFNFELLTFLKLEKHLENIIFSKNELDNLEKYTLIYRKKTTNNPLAKRELERMIVEFSWKSSQIEGNTYSLLETEELLKNGLNSPLHTPEETEMILNHKKAFNYIQENIEIFKDAITPSNIIILHTIITKHLGIDTDLRKHGVGITGSLYKPLDNQYQIEDAMKDLCQAINNHTNPYIKAFVIGLIIAYIQPFSDGNKRTARIISNAILYAHDLPMLPFRSVNTLNYKRAVISFYEYNSTSLYRTIFLEQLKYSVENYF